MAIKPKQRLQRVYWKDVRSQVKKLQPEFAKLVDEIDPGKDFPLYIARYCYGDLIVKEGLFHLPDENKNLVPITHAELPTIIRKELGFGKFRIAPGIVLDKSIELFVKPNGRILPWKYYPQKTIFGLWGYLERDYMDGIPSYHPARIFDISAGSRCSFFLPSIGDIAYHNNIERTLCTRFPIARNLLDQHKLFVKLLKHPKINSDWCTEIMFFSENWVEKLNSNDSSWGKLRLHLLNFVWGHTGFWRNKQLYDLIFSWAQGNYDLKLNPYLADTAKHLIQIAAGYGLGFFPAINDVAAPVSLLQTIFLDIYNIKYNPVFLHPNYFHVNSANNQVAYYSLNFPNALEFSQSSKRYSATLQDLRDLRHILKFFVGEICNDNLKLADTPLKDDLDAVSFEFFHTNEDSLFEIQNATNLLKNDKFLKGNLVDSSKNMPFASYGSFLKGCVSIRSKSS